MVENNAVMDEVGQKTGMVVLMYSVSASDQGILRGPQIMGWTNQNPTAKQRWSLSPIIPFHSGAHITVEK